MEEEMSRFAGWEEGGLRTVKFLEKISEKFVAKRSPRGARHKKPLRLSRYPSTLASIVPIPARSIHDYLDQRIIARILVISGSKRSLRCFGPSFGIT